MCVLGVAGGSGKHTFRFSTSETHALFRQCYLAAVRSSPLHLLLGRDWRLLMKEVGKTKQISLPGRGRGSGDGGGGGREHLLALVPTQ